MVEYSEIARPVTFITVVFSRAWLFEIVELKLTNIDYWYRSVGFLKKYFNVYLSV
jgi:hypothetical protein